jgi:hypothetical protein
MLLAQAVTISEIPGWVVYVFAVVLVVALIGVVRGVLSHPRPE